MHAAVDLVGGELLAVKELHHEFLVGLGDHLHELGAVLVRLFLECGGDVDLLAVERERLAREDIDITRHLAAFHDGELDGNDLGILRRDRVHGGGKVGVFLVDRVDEYERGHALFDAHFESFLGADGERTRSAGHHHRAVGCRERRHHLAFEIEESGDIEDVDLDILVDGAGKRHGDGYLALDLFVVVVHRGGAVVHLAETVDGLGEVKHGFRERSLALAGMPDERDVADEVGCESFHVKLLIFYAVAPKTRLGRNSYK